MCGFRISALNFKVLVIKHIQIVFSNHIGNFCHNISVLMIEIHRRINLYLIVSCNFEYLERMITESAHSSFDGYWALCCSLTNL